MKKNHKKTIQKLWILCLAICIIECIMGIFFILIEEKKSSLSQAGTFLTIFFAFFAFLCFRKIKNSNHTNTTEPPNEQYIINTQYWDDRSKPTMKCTKCGSELKFQYEEYSKDSLGNPLYKSFIYCEMCDITFELDSQTDNIYTQHQNQSRALRFSMYNKFYLSTWFIALCFAFSFLIIPAFVGAVLVIMQIIENSKLKKKYGCVDELNEDISFKTTEIGNKNIIISQKSQKIDELEKKISSLKSQLISEETIQVANSLDYSSFDSYTSEECKNQLSIIQQEEKMLIKAGDAIHIRNTQNKKKINDNSKQILRCFNAECDNIILSTSIKNIDTLRTKLIKSFDTLNKIFEIDGISLSNKILEYKLKELTLIYECEKKHKEEREIQKAIKEQMLEEERVKRELEKRKSEIEKDQKQFNNEVTKLIKYMQKTQNDIEKQLYADKIKELEEKIKALESEKTDVINREQNAKAGFVYIISNIGSFGDNIYKIGMTRRLEPMDRIKELSSASVPFEFDVHAMIFSDDAPALEYSLHQHFNKYRVNKINSRKEFFNVSIDLIEEYVIKNYNNTVEFTKIPVAKEYRDTQALYKTNETFLNV